jgi:tRNA uridine 5-carbamoylmethylation protein Kti12
MSNQEPKTPITESLVREVISSYNSLKGKYRLDAPIFMTTDEIIEQITKDLNKTNVEDQR